MGLTQSPAFSFYAKDFLTGTMTLSLAARGAYITLLAYQWDHGSIPDDPVARARILGCPLRQANALWEILLAKFSREQDSTWRNPRLESERAKQMARQAELSRNGQRGAEARWRDGRTNDMARPMATPLATPMATPMANRWQKDGSSSSSSSSSSEDQDPHTHARETEAKRAGDFCQWYAETHERLIQVGYIGNPRKDYETALMLVAKFDDAELRDAATFWFGQRDGFATNGTRSIPKFASRASVLVATVREVV